MLLSYQECLEKYGTDYKIKKCVQEGELYVKEKGIYSDKRYVPELEIISKKYPNAIITLNSAFYYYGLTDTIPDFYYVATPKNTRKISDERVKQFYENSEAFVQGVGYFTLGTRPLKRGYPLLSIPVKLERNHPEAS